MKYHIIKNVLTNQERKKLIKDCQPYLMTGKEMSDMLFKEKNIITGRYPGRQTREYLHTIPCFQLPINKILRAISEEFKRSFVLQMSWINWTNGNKEDINWHNHPYTNYSAVYYIKTFPFFNNGTLFEDGFIKSPQNSVLIFPAEIKHTAPSSPLRFDRYTMALDLGNI